MSDFWLYVKLGFEHVLDWNAYDHTLFIIALCASHTFASWKRMLIHVTFFTLGHSVSLGLATYQLASMDSAWIEFLIPVTILITALVSIMNAVKSQLQRTEILLIIATFFFGIIHGFGFAGYFNMINEGNAFTHLLEFALGIELAQILIAMAIVTLAYVAQNVLGLQKKYWVIIVSSIAAVLAIPMLIENWIGS